MWEFEIYLCEPISQGPMSKLYRLFALAIIFWIRQQGQNCAMPSNIHTEDKCEFRMYNVVFRAILLICGEYFYAKKVIILLYIVS